MNDPWQKSLNIILEMERKYEVRSTLFFIPFSKDPGHTPGGNKAPINRACYYDILNHASLIQSLE